MDNKISPDEIKQTIIKSILFDMQEKGLFKKKKKELIDAVEKRLSEIIKIQVNDNGR